MSEPIRPEQVHVSCDCWRFRFFYLFPRNWGKPRTCKHAEQVLAAFWKAHEKVLEQKGEGEEA